MTIDSNERKTEQQMQDRMTDSQAPIDRATSASIRSAIGERLRKNLQPEPSSLPSHLQQLLDAMEKQDRDNAAGKTGA
jgi:hypothetical protein